ncbi:MAG: methylated-DNA--[protein]-cysteine S-methyltransferase [Thermoflavifilum sp.]|nr:methylated-DNA--[protein]-cysteine S-methyltransferase [Thermoflavifilum sp.]
MYHQYLSCALGWLEIRATDRACVRVLFVDAPQGAERPNAITRLAVQQLQEYMDRRRQIFELPIEMLGSPFQKKVWQALLQIPYGSTMSYLVLSQLLGDEKAIRAVAQANGSNPLPIIVPCHRVVGSDGSLTGYSGGIWRKKWLLQHEQPWVQTKLDI